MKGEKDIGTSGTITQPSIKKDYPKIVVEKGEMYFQDRHTGEMKKVKEYVIGKTRDQANPVTIGREHPGTIGRRDILLSRRYDCASREHCEIFFDRNENAYFLTDYSLNGTLVNGDRVGGNRVRETRRLEHKDLIKIPAIGESIEIRFLTEELPGWKEWVEGKELAEKPLARPPSRGIPAPSDEEEKFCMFCGAEMVKGALYCPKCGKKQ